VTTSPGVLIAGAGRTRLVRALSLALSGVVRASPRGAAGAAYLVRPDGYVALADPRADAARLAAHLKNCHIRSC
jgi:hypothetical protein